MPIAGLFLNGCYHKRTAPFLDLMFIFASYHGRRPIWNIFSAAHDASLIDPCRLYGLLVAIVLSIQLNIRCICKFRSTPRTEQTGTANAPPNFHAPPPFMRLHGSVVNSHATPADQSSLPSGVGTIMPAPPQFPLGRLRPVAAPELRARHRRSIRRNRHIDRWCS